MPGEELGGGGAILVPVGFGGGVDEIAAPVDLVRTGIAEGLAALERVVPSPVAPLGYGSDISCERDLNASMKEVDGLLALAQSLVRRLDCPRGQLVDDGAYGIDIRARLNRAQTANEVRALAGQVRSELAADDRVDAISVTLTPSSTGTRLQLALRIVPVDRRLGPFTATLAVTSAAVLLEEITP